MKKLLFVFIIILAFASFVSGQNADKKWSVACSAGTNQYRGDLGSDLYRLPFYLYGGLSGARYINPSFDVSLQLSYGGYGIWNNTPRNFVTQKFDGSLMGKYKLNNGYILPEGPVSPYLTAGAGVAKYFEGRNFNTDDMDLVFPVGFGFKVELCESMALQYQFAYNFTFADDRDIMATVPHGDYNDGYFQQSVGLVFMIGKVKDEDNDGIADIDDKCPSTPALVIVDQTGCPYDTDEDGILDYLDKCPDIKGIASLGGCPDKDGDGITDAEDKCPDVKGIAQFTGCPDTDLDGIQDSEDKCPDVKGIAKFEGCPDTDGDGITDKLDDCPNEKGLAAFNGCPDTDGDGIMDKDDNCKNIVGVAANFGCPEIKEETKKVFEQALTGIQFETGSDAIKRSSYTILDKVGKVMVDNPNYMLEIAGHTDNVGDPQKNLELSDKRAKAVMQYLVSKGIDAERMTAKGFGDTLPVEDNKTPEGRTANRRVEFKVVFAYSIKPIK